MALRLRIGPFRGLAPYVEEDESLLFGRDVERRALTELVLAASGPSVLLLGESGAGKTSLVRAGLMPRLAAANWLPVYLECGPGWREELGRTLRQQLQHPVSPEQPLEEATLQLARQRSARPVLILDHLEQLLWLDKEQEVSRLGAFAARVVATGGQVVLVLDEGHAHALERVASYLSPVPDARRIQVGRMDRTTAARVMEQTVIAGGGYMEAGLPELIADELTAEGPVLPAALQVVGHAALLAESTRTKRYIRTGGASALSNLYVERIVDRAGGLRARRVLAVLSEHPNPRHGRQVNAIAQACGLGPAMTRVTLEALEREGLITRYAGPGPSDDGAEACYGLIHPYLLQPVRDAVAPVLRGRAQARLSLRRRIHGPGLLRPDEILRVWLFLGQSISGPEQEEFRRGIRLWAYIAASLVALPLLVLILFYGILATSSYVDTRPERFGARQVVVRAGRPSLRFAFHLVPGRFGDPIVETGLTFSSLPPAAQALVLDEDVVGGRRLNGPALPYWLQELGAALPTVRRGALQLLAGDEQGGSQLLQHAASIPDERRKAAWALALLSGDTPATRQGLMLSVEDLRPDVRRMAVTEAQRLGAGSALPVMAKAIDDRDNQVRLAAVEGLRVLPPESGLPLLAHALVDADPRVRDAALAHATRMVTAEPVHVYEVARTALARLPGVRAEATAAALEQLLERAQQKAPRQLAVHLVSRAIGQGSDQERISALNRLVSMAAQAPAEQLQRVVQALEPNTNAQVRAAVITLKARFAEATQSEEQLTPLAQSRQPLMRRAAAAGLGLVQGRPSADRLKLLRRLLKDGDPSVREAAVRSLMRIGAGGLNEVVKGMKRGPRDVALIALRETCREHSEADQRMVTPILAAAWRIKLPEVRGETLRCARRLAEANPRLSLWLADQARVDKHPEVRQAAAQAVALAVKQSGQRAEGLTRVYLRQDDILTTTSVLRAMVQRPPERASWLFREIARLTAHRDATIRASAAALLIVVAPTPAPAVEVFERLFGDGAPEVVNAALHAAMALEPSAAAQRLDGPLARVVAGPGRRSAVAALQLAQRLGLAAPVRQAALHPEPEVRAAAVALLAGRGDARQALGVLESALRDPEPALRLAALKAIGEQSGRLGEAAVALLGRSTQAASPIERGAAFVALGRVKGGGLKAAIELLTAASRHPSEEQRRLAMRPLAALAPHAPAAAELLINGALDPAFDVRTEARAALGEYLGRHSSLDELWMMLRGSERNAVLRHVALSALAWWGRAHRPAELRQMVTAKMAEQPPLVIQMCLRLAAALGKRTDSPEEVIGWLFGW